MILLNALHRQLSFLERADGFHGGFGGGHVGGVGDFLGDRGGADQDLIGAGLVGRGGVDEEMDFVVLHHVDDVGACLLQDFVNAACGDAGFGELRKGAAGGDELETELMESPGDGDGAVFIEVGDGEEDGAFLG